jgi:transposase
MNNVVPIEMPALNEHAQEIRKLGKQIVGDVIEIGRRLSECRTILKQSGKWRAWLNTEFGWSRRSAERFIDLYDMSKSDHGARVRHSNLPLRTLYLLANPSTPEKVRKEILTGRAERKITHKDIAKRIRHSKGGNAAELTAERRGTIEKAILDGMSRDKIVEKFACSNDTVGKLRKQLTVEGKLTPGKATPGPTQTEPIKPQSKLSQRDEMRHAYVIYLRENLTKDEQIEEIQKMIRRELGWTTDELSKLIPMIRFRI